MSVPMILTVLKTNINFVMTQRVLISVTVSQDFKSNQMQIIHVKV